MKDKVRYGILGFGHFAERAIITAIRESANSELVALQKRSLKTAREKAAEHRVPLAFDSAEQLASHPEVDAVFIVSANVAHYADTLAAARAGKHVLVEKPMALNTREVEEMTEECRKQGVKLMVGHMLRFSPAVLRIRDFVRSGSLGDIIMATSQFVYDGRNSKRTWLRDPNIAGGGPILDVGVHCLDTMRFVLEDEVVSTKSQMEPVFGENETEMTALLGLKFTSGVIGTILCSFAAPVRRTRLEIVGTEGITECKNFTVGDHVAEVRVSFRNAQNGPKTAVESIQVPNLCVEEISRFSDAILKDLPSPIPGEEGIANQRVLDAARQS